MAKPLILLQYNTFIVQMDDKDMEMLTELCQRRKANYPDTVVACFHNGLLKMSSCVRCNQKAKTP